MTADVFIVHAIDTEGPLYESLEAKFDRLRHLFGITHLPKTRETFRSLQRGEIPVNGMEKHIQTVLSGHLTTYFETWTEVDEMLTRIFDPAFRERMTDSGGGGWIFNWFCLDHINFDYNPRRRDIGYHNIFDHYREILADRPDCGDRLQWHFHPMSTYNDAHRCATHFFRSPEVFEILSRKIIEREFFPSVFRAGFQCERPDSHWFLEQWIPFDISNMALDDNSGLEATTDFRNGRSGDWRRAPSDWSVYHPDHDDYQSAGNCRRVIGRALNVLNRIASIDQVEMDKAFRRSADGKPALVGIASHDFRDLETEVDFLRDLVAKSSQKYPDVKFHFCEAADAFRRMIAPEGAGEPALDLELTLHPVVDNDVPFLEIVAKQGKVFGPQPFLAIETRSRRFLHDNLDFSTEGDRWFYAFHDDTLPLEDVARIGVAANDRNGNTSVKVLDLRGRAAS